MVEIKKPITMKVWKTGTGLVITIPKSLIEGLGIEKGDKVKILITDVIKNVANSNKTRK